MGLDESKIRISKLIKLTDKQLEAISTVEKYRYVLYGGARGGGKSVLLRWWLIHFLVTMWKKTGQERIRVVLFCENYPALQDRQITKIKTEVPSWLGEVKSTASDGLCLFLKPEFGSGIVMLRNLDDPSKYQSAEYAACGVDELTKISKETFDILRGSLRWAGIEQTRFLGCSNPGGVGHAWVKRLWIDRVFPPELIDKAGEFAFVQSLPTDNPHLSESYWEELNSLPDTMKEAWLYGNWQVFQGMAFPNWNEVVHVCDPFRIPENWTRYVGIDWGYAKPFCAVWRAKDPDTGRHFVYREAYGAGYTDAQQAMIIKEMSGDEVISAYFADWQMWSPKSHGDFATSTADEYTALGIPVIQANKNRINGKNKIDRLLNPLLDGKPGLMIFRTCRNGIRTMPLLAYSESRPEDVDTDQEDHFFDALKYSLTNEVAEIKKVIEKTRSPFEKLKWVR